MKKIHTILFLVICISIVSPDRSPAQSGGSFTLEQTVVAGGGSTITAGGNFKIDGTIGQAAAGARNDNSPFRSQIGFWTAPAAFGPTSAEVTISGRLTTANGNGIRNVRVALAGPQGFLRIATSGSFGYYSIANVPAGQTYILTVASKRFIFPVPTRILTLLEDSDGIDFVSEP